MPDPILWGARLSPFSLKLEAAFQYKGIAYRRLPAEGSHFENARALLRLEAAKRLGDITRYPEHDPTFDEYPLLPYFSYNKRHFEYDSSSILRRMEAQNEGQSLIPSDPTIAFLVRFIDQAFNEFGLYIAHHRRWVTSAKSNTMGRRLAAEFKTALPPGGAWLISRTFPPRQVKRLRYLMSYPPKGFKSGVKSSLTPQYSKDFPETHSLLDQSWKAIVNAMESILSKQNYLFGAHFTLADASAYGQLGMNLVDPQAADELKQTAPRTFAWLKAIEQGQFVARDKNAEPLFKLTPRMSTLLNVLMGTYGALMVQNEHAFNEASRLGITQFNEAAFDKNEAMFNGKLQGYTFRTVVKTFQVRPWRELKADWQTLNEEAQNEVAKHMQLTELFAQR